MESTLDLVKRRNELCGKVLELTEAAYFTSLPEDIEADVTRYTELYEQRETLVAELAGIHSQIGEEGYAAISEAGGEAAEILAQSEERLARIVALDKKNKEQGEIIYKAASEGIRRIKQGKNASQMYNDHSETGGKLFDSKN